MKRAPSAARAIERAMSRHTPAAPKPAPDAWVREGLAELDRRQRQREAEREAQRQAELDATPTTTMILRELGRATSRGSTPIPLNGAGILRAALGGGAGTIEGNALR